MVNFIVSDNTGAAVLLKVPCSSLVVHSKEPFHIYQKKSHNFTVQPKKIFFVVYGKVLSVLGYILAAEIESAIRFSPSRQVFKIPRYSFLLF